MRESEILRCFAVSFTNDFSLQHQNGGQVPLPRVPDPDPDPAFHSLIADPDPAPHLSESKWWESGLWTLQGSIWVSSLHCELSANPHTALHSNADPDPAPQQSDGNLRPLVYRSARAPLWSYRLQDFIVSFKILTLMRIRNQLFTLMGLRIRIQLPKIMRIWIRNLYLPT